MKTDRIKIFTPGTCGELIQGKIADKYFLVTAPINLFSIVTIEVVDKSSDIFIPPKAIQALKLFFSFFNIKEKYIKISINSHIPLSKGMSSSSADISGILYALSRIYGIKLSPYDIAKMSVKIEPTDGVMFPGISLFDYIDGTKWEYIGKPLPLKILVVDFGGEIDTVNFNKSDKREKFSYINDELAMLKIAFKEKNIKLFGEIITKSALENQNIIYKKNLEELIDTALSMGAIGVNVAHTGTTAGIFCPYSKVQKVSEIYKYFSHLKILGWYNFTGGGHLTEFM